MSSVFSRWRSSQRCPSSASAANKGSAVVDIFATTCEFPFLSVIPVVSAQVSAPPPSKAIAHTSEVSNSRGAMTRFVDENGVEMLFGCSSFKGTDAELYADAFAMLKDRHLAPRRWLPRVKAPSVFRFAQKLRLRKPDAKLAMLGMPPLLRTYLLMGGWVSDHAVVDAQMNTLHVFTGLEIAASPPTRKRLLRATAG